MTLKMTFLGSGSAFTVAPENYHSNVLLEIDKDSLLIDAGSDLRHSLREHNKGHLDIKNVYLTHLHNDHCGGMEWLALKTYFDPNYKDKPNLYLPESLACDLWDKRLAAGLGTLSGINANLTTFFNLHALKRHEGFIWQNIEFKLVQMIHCYNEYEFMPCFGLFFTYNNTRIFYTGDTQKAPIQLLAFYEEADIIFHDCETQPHLSGVHAHYSELVELPLHVKNKMWLYHYNPGKLPNAKKDGFLGFVAKGQHFIF